MIKYLHYVFIKKYGAKMLPTGVTGMEVTSELCTRNDAQQLLGVNCSVKQHIKIPLHVTFPA